MIFRWIREPQYSDFGLIKTGDVKDTEKDKIPEDVAKIWVETGWAEEVKPKEETRLKKTKSESQGGE